MLSETAKNDLAALRAAGFEPSDEEVVKLNELALKMEAGRDVTPACMPRVAFAGNVVLHEPTIGALQWWNDFGQDAAFTSEGRLYTYYFMLANARDIDKLVRLADARDIRKAVRAWKKKCGATPDELWRALKHVKYGETPVSEEDLAAVREKEGDNGMENLWNLMIYAAGAMGISPENLKTQTPSVLDALFQVSVSRLGRQVKRSIADEYVKYRQIMRKIEERGKKNG